MNNWQEHTVQFAPAEGLEKNETEVRVLDHDVSPSKRDLLLEDRVQDLRAESTADQLKARQALTEEVRKDPGYKFLMMVSAFSTFRLNRIVSVSKTAPQSEGDIGDDFSSKDHGEEFKWMQAPEVSGVIFLSPTVYGHMKEAEAILNTGFLQADLKTLVETPEYATLFARLVSIRMSLSAALNGIGGRLDKTYLRLHQQQTAVLEALKHCKVKSLKSVDFTRPTSWSTRFRI